MMMKSYLSNQPSNELGVQKQRRRLHRLIPPPAALLVIIFRLTIPSSKKMSARLLLSTVVLLFVILFVSSQQVLMDIDEQNGVDDSPDSGADYYAIMPWKRQQGRPVWAKYAWMRTPNGGKRAASQRYPQRNSVLRYASLINI